VDPEKEREALRRGFVKREKKKTQSEHGKCSRQNRKEEKKGRGRKDDDISSFTKKKFHKMLEQGMGKIKGAKSRGIETFVIG